MNIFRSPEVESKILSDTVFLGWMLKTFKFWEDSYEKAPLNWERSICLTAKTGGFRGVAVIQNLNYVCLSSGCIFKVGVTGAARRVGWWLFIPKSRWDITLNPRVGRCRVKCSEGKKSCPLGWWGRDAAGRNSTGVSLCSIPALPLL